MATIQWATLFEGTAVEALDAGYLRLAPGAEIDRSAGVISYRVSTPATRDAWLHFVRFLECLCLDEGSWLPSSESVGDAVHWHQTMLSGQYR